MKQLVLPVAWIALIATGFSEEVPAITVSKSDKLSIAISGL